MAKMLGLTGWWGLPCTCCNRSRTARRMRKREARQWRRELRDQL